MAAESENTRAYLGAIASSFGAGEIHEAVERTASRESGLLSLLAYKAMSFQACAHSGCSMMVSAQVSGGCKAAFAAQRLRLPWPEVPICVGPS